MLNLLQIGVDTLTTAANTVLQGDINTDGKLGFWEILVMGGWVMVPLAIMLLATIFVFSERAIAIKHAARIDGNFMNIIRDHIVGR
jgi:biopolymer transport protein ExbB